MTRCRTWIAIGTLLILATALAVAATPQNAEGATLRAKLRHAKRELKQARTDLAAAQAALDAALAATTTTTTGTPEPSPSPVSAAPVADVATIDGLQVAVNRAQRAVKRWTVRVRQLTKAYRVQRRLAAWERRGQWRPIIRYAAARYHVSAARIYRMMWRESRGHRFAGASSPFKGLFQYHSATWRARWNPWRHQSIFDGSAQIFATCYAVHRGYGPSMWANTF